MPSPMMSNIVGDLAEPSDSYSMIWPLMFTLDILVSRQLVLVIRRRSHACSRRLHPIAAIMFGSIHRLIGEG